MERQTCERLPPRPPDVRAAAEAPAASGLTFRQAEELLDWLEAHGQTGLSVSCLKAGGVRVRGPSSSAPPRR